MVIDISNDLERFKIEIMKEISELVKIINTSKPKEWLTEKEACNYLSVSKSTIQNYRSKGILPFSKLNNKIYIKMADIESLLERNSSKNGGI